MKTTLSLAALFVLVLGGGYAWHAYSQQAYSAPSSYSAAAAGTEAATSKITSSTTGSTASPAAIAPTPAATPAPKPSATAGGYTAAQVATHSNNSSCWTSINGNVYDLTAWISKHPGGEGAILSICGKDGSAAFNGQHGGNGRAQQALAMFKIGALAQ